MQIDKLHPMPSDGPPSPSHRHDDVAQPDRGEAPADLIAAIDSLSEDEIDYLLNYAHYRMLRARAMVLHSDAEDLLNEAILRTRGGTRKWNPTKTFRAHLVGCMNSIANEWSKRGSKYTTLSDSHVSKYTTEAGVEARLNLDRLQRSLRGDSVALSVLETVQDGLSPKEACQLLNIDEHIYWAARKRLKRQYDRLFGPSQDKSRG